jgi:hypothetical protein
VSEDVGLVHIPHALGSRRAGRSAITRDPGVVDEYVERTDRPHCRGHGRGVRDIELYRSCAELLGRLLPAVLVARADPHLVARGDKLTGGLEPQSLVGPCDE